MIQKLFQSWKTLNSLSVRQTFFLSTATVINSALGLVFYAIVARSLSISDFGYFSLLLAIGVLGADLFDFGMGSAIVRFIGTIPFPQLFTVVSVQRLLVGGILFGLVVIVSLLQPINLSLSAIIAVSLLLVYQVTQSLVAWQKYWALSAVNIFGNLCRIVITIVLVNTKQILPETALIAIVGANLSALLIGIFLIIHHQKKILFSFSNFFSNLKTITGFSNWLGLSFGTAALSSRLDIPLIYFLGGPVMTGIYSSAQKLASVLPQISASAENVFAPKIATREQSSPIHKEYLLVSVILAVGIVVLTPMLSWVVPLVFGQKYLASIPTLQILFAASGILLVGGPFSAAVLYRYGKSAYHLSTSLFQLVLSASLYFILVPHYGAVGAAVSTLIVSVSLVIIYIFMATRLSKKYA